MKTEENDFVKRRIVANVIDSDEVNFLCGKDTIKKQRKGRFEDDNFEFKGKDQNIKLMESEDGHILVKLEFVRTWMIMKQCI